MYLAVPSIAIMNPSGEQASVFVVDGTNHANLRKVRPGIVVDAMTEITDGLKEGEKVVTVGQFYLKDNDKVRIYIAIDLQITSLPVWQRCCSSCHVCRRRERALEAPPNHALTLHDCIAIALGESPALEASRFDVLSAAQEVRAAQGMALPLVTGSAQYQLFSGSQTSKFARA